MANYDITTAAARLEFDTVDNGSNSCYPIDSNHFINFYQGSDSDGYVEVFTVNTTTWEVATAAARLEFDTVNNSTNSCYKVDTNHFINFYGGSDSDGYVEIFAVDTTTWAVTTTSARLEFDTVSGSAHSCYKVDVNHFINFWQGSDGDGYTQVFTVDTTTWAVTTAAASLEFDTVAGSFNSCYQIDSNHFINFWGGSDGDNFAQVFTVNTTTWAVSTANATLEFDTIGGPGNKCFQVDANHFINFYSGSDSDGYVEVFTVNTTTWAITTANTRLEFDTVLNGGSSCYRIDTTHFINFWAGSDSDGFVQAFTVDTTTWAVTTTAAALEFDTVGGQTPSCYQIDTAHYINFWQGESSDGFVQVFTVEVPSSAQTTVGLRIQDKMNILAGTTGRSVIDCLNIINSASDTSEQDAFNRWAGTTGLRKQDAANVKAGTTGLRIQDCVNLI